MNPRENAGDPALENQETIETTNETSEDQEQPEIENNDDAPEGDDSDEGSQGDDESESGDEGELAIPDPDVDPETEASGKKKKEMPEWMKKKIEREKAAAQLKEDEAARLKEENEKLRQMVQSGQLPNVEHEEGPDPYLPQRDQFRSDSEYHLALLDYRDARRAAKQNQEKQVGEYVKAERDYQTGLKNMVEEGKAKYKNFEEVGGYVLYSDEVKANRAMGEAIVASEHRSDILYFLGTHTKEAQRISNLSPIAAVKEIQKLETRLEQKKRKPITQASKVISAVGGGKSGAANTRDPGKMGQEDFNTWYKSQYG